MADGCQIGQHGREHVHHLECLLLMTGLCVHGPSCAPSTKCGVCHAVGIWEVNGLLMGWHTVLGNAGCTLSQ